MREKLLSPNPASAAARSQTHSPATHWAVNTERDLNQCLLLLWLPPASAWRGAELLSHSPSPRCSRPQALCQQHCFTTISPGKQRGSQNFCINELPSSSLRGKATCPALSIFNHLQNHHRIGENFSCTSKFYKWLERTPEMIYTI